MKVLKKCKLYQKIVWRSGWRFFVQFGAEGVLQQSPRRPRSWIYAFEEGKKEKSEGGGIQYHAV